MLILSLTPTLLVLQVTFFAVLHGHKWTYNGPEGEHHWPKHYPFCGGAFQSPIDIKTELLRFDPTLRPIEVHNYNLSAYEELTLGNNGHSMQLSLPSRMFISGLPHRYTAAQLHFHWGSSNRPAGSEHTVEGHQFAAEMHVVHFNSDKYPNISMAMDKSDGLAVLGVLIEVGEFNPAFEKFLRFINGIKYRDQRVKVAGFNIKALLPARLDEYYRYDGSLTTPPCYPSVLWTLFRNHVTISHRQFMNLATAMYSSHAQDSAPVPLNGNYRKPQLTDNRLVLVSFKDGRGLYGPLTVTSPLVRKRIIQQLLVGDLADLADEGLYKLLPQAGVNPPTSNKWRYLNSQYEYGGTLSMPKQQRLYPSLHKKSQSNRYAGMPGLAEDALCYGTVEQEIMRQLRRSRGGSDLVQALRDAIFPGLNLKSYLECKSDLALSTIRLILRDRPTDEATELERSLTRATMGLRKFPQGMKLPVAQSKYEPLPPLTNYEPLPPLTKYEPLSPLAKHEGFHPGTLPGKSQAHGAQFTWILPMEVED